jgi:hypothetical protein
MRPELYKKLGGFSLVSRSRFLLLESKLLKMEEFVLFELYISVADWDVRHERYGTVKTTNQEVAGMLGWTQGTTVGRYKKALGDKNFIRISQDDAIEIVDFSQWIKGHNPKADLNAEMRPAPANTHIQPAEMHDSPAQNVSYKDNLAFSNGLSMEDVTWINTNVREDPTIREQVKVTNSLSTLVETMTSQELFIFAKEIFGEGTRVVSNGEVWE